MNRVLVTGAAGFVGRCTVPLLLEAGYDVHTVIRRPFEPLPGVHTHVANLLSRSEQAAVLRTVRPTHLLHLAWSVPPGQFWNAIENIEWLQASLNLLLNFADVGGQRWVGAGSCAEYDWSRGARFRECDPSRPSTLYGTCKSAVQVTISQAGPLLGVQTAWGRVFFPYGPAEPATRLVPSAIRALLHGEPAPCTEGRQVRDFIYVEDVARAFVLLLASSVTGPVNIASGVDVAIGDVVTAIGRLIGRPELLQIGALPMRDFEPREITADISILASLGFMPAYTLEQGLQRAIDWWKAH